MRKFKRLAFALGLLAATACGGDSDDDGPEAPVGGDGSTTIDTGLPEETPLESVTPEQYSNACESLREDVRSRLGPTVAQRGVCEVYGAVLSDDTAECNDIADDCAAQYAAGMSPGPVLPTPEQLDLTSFECGDVGELQGCTVTIGEFETCLEDRMTALETVMNENNCDNAADVDISGATALGAGLAASPPSCARVEELCPGIGPFADLPSAP